jgi:hypothetical protein
MDLDIIHAEMLELHPSYNRESMDEFVRDFIGASDKEGFIFPFDAAWRAAGYARKDHGKRALRDLREGVDYKVENVRVTIQGHVVVFPSTGENPSTPLYTENTPQVAFNTGGAPSEKITLTARGLNQFALAARTATGVVLRDLVLALMRGVKRLRDEIDAGRVELRRVPVDVRDAKRLKACDSQKYMMQAVHESGQANPAVCASINALTNLTATGLHKKEIAAKFGKSPASFNCRDTYNDVRLAFVEYQELLSAEMIKTEMQKDAAERRPVYSIHESEMRNVSSEARAVLHRQPFLEPRSLYSVRKGQRDQALLQAPQTAPAIEAPFAVPVAAPVAAPTPSTPSVNKITIYFNKK